LGGSMGGIQLHADDNWGSILGGRFAHVYVHDACFNGVDIHAFGNSSIEHMYWSDLRVVSNGRKNQGTDDEFGLYLFGSDTGSVRNNLFFEVTASGNMQYGLRMKGRVYKNQVVALNLNENGIGAASTASI